MSDYKVKFVDFPKQYKKYKREIDHALLSTIESGQYILGDKVKEFEEKLAQHVGTKYAVAVGHGTDALTLSLRALGIGKGDEVITTSYTFRATVEAIWQTGATPVLADIGEDWRKYQTKKTKAIIPAHIAGAHHDWETEGGIIMIEDACQAITAFPVKGITACYSFYPAKILGTFGDGGAIATNSRDVYEHLLQLRNHFKGYWGRGFGYNSRLDNIHAAILSEKIDHLPEMILRRKQIGDMYNQGLRGVTPDSERNVYQDYIIECASEEERDALHAHLENEGIQTMKNGYPFPNEAPKKPKAQEYEDRSLRLPCNDVLEDEEVEYVIAKVNEFFTK